METMQGLERTHHCGNLRKSDAGIEVVLTGWVSRRRDHGGLIFVDMRDRSGLIQLVFDAAAMSDFHKAETLRNEFVIAIKGKIRERSGIHEQKGTREAYQRRHQEDAARCRGTRFRECCHAARSDD